MLILKKNYPSLQAGYKKKERRKTTVPEIK
jgi:hypothetical protein